MLGVVIPSFGWGLRVSRQEERDAGNLQVLAHTFSSLHR